MSPVEYNIKMIRWNRKGGNPKELEIGELVNGKLRSQGKELEIDCIAEKAKPKPTFEWWLGGEIYTVLQK